MKTTYFMVVKPVYNLFYLLIPVQKGDSNSQPATINKYQQQFKWQGNWWINKNLYQGMKENDKKMFLPNIGICIAMDLIGMASFIFPGMGEFTDVIWAPISGYIFFKLFGCL